MFDLQLVANPFSAIKNSELLFFQFARTKISSIKMIVTVHLFLKIVTWSVSDNDFAHTSTKLNTNIKYLLCKKMCQREGAVV